jgi:5'-3' exonuclease
VRERVVQVDRRSGQIRDEQGIRDRFGVAPAFIPDYLALVGDASDGYPGIPGLGAKTAARLIASHGHIEQFPYEVLRDNKDLARLFKNLATLRIDAPLFENVNELRWSGPTDAFASVAEAVGDARLAARIRDLQFVS